MADACFSITDKGCAESKGFPDVWVFYDGIKLTLIYIHKFSLKGPTKKPEMSATNQQMVPSEYCVSDCFFLSATFAQHFRQDFCFIRDLK